ncbi:MAG: tetratricopeptide repeat protein [Myxococcales bacterium]|nr:tetratricopeptide repeat protein [Myxococcales bacterium]
MSATSTRALALSYALSCALLGAACGGSSAQLEAVEVPPADPAAVREYLAGVRILERTGGNQTARDRRARERFVEALRIDPNLWEAHYNLGVIQRRAGQLEEAAASFERAAQIAPTAPEPLLAAAETAYARGDRDAAATQLQRLVERAPEDLSARTALAIILRGRGRFDDALTQAREVLVRDPQNVRALLEIGRIERARERFDVARLVLDKARQLVPEGDARTRAEVLNEVGLLELDRGDNQAAFEAFDAAVAADAGYAPSRTNMGSVLLAAGDYQGAAAQYQAVLRSNADDLAARLALGIALRGQGDHRRARQEYERVLEAEPTHADALYNLAILRAEFLDERTQSRETFQRFLDAAPRNHPKRSEAQRYLRELE